MDVRETLKALRDAWWVVVLGALVGGGIALAASLFSTPLYSAHTQLFVSTANSGSTLEVYQGSQFSQQRVTSYRLLLGGEELAGRVIDRLDLGISPQELASQVRAESAIDTVLLDVSVMDPSAQRAQRIAGAIGSEFAEMVTELETPDGETSSPVKVTVTDRPEVPEEPSSPQTVPNVAVGLAIGLLLGAAIAVARVRLDRSVKAPTNGAEPSGPPIIGTILRDDALVLRRVVDFSKVSRTAEDYRQLRTNLQFLNVDDPPKVIMVTSPMPAEGKTTVVLNLALALAEAGRQVTVVDADLRRPRVTTYLGMVGGVGLTNILAGTADMAEVVQTFGDTKVSVIGAGPTPPNPSELLASKHMFALIDELRGKSEYVLIDAPPLLPVADATGLAVMVDGVLISVRYGKSRKDQLQQAVTTLERVGARTLGLILNIVPPKAGITAAYGYGYTYAETEVKGGQRYRP